MEVDERGDKKLTGTIMRKVFCGSLIILDFILKTSSI